MESSTPRSYRTGGTVLPGTQECPTVAESRRTHLGRHFPTMTLVEVSRLTDPNAVVEIEAELVPP